VRLDVYLVENGYFDSRNKAREAIEGGLVSLNETVIKKPSFLIKPSDRPSVDGVSYVSRSALKLKHFLLQTSLEVADKVCLDIGASTGGFTQVLLEFGASEVTALDVGNAQLHPKLLSDNRVKSRENCDIRDFTTKKEFAVVTCDISFIGLQNVIKDIDRVSSELIILLFKPQFEVGREASRSKNGVVTDAGAIEMSRKKFENNAEDIGWKLLVTKESHIKGKEGNIEFFYAFTKKDHRSSHR